MLFVVDEKELLINIIMWIYNKLVFQILLKK